jgi:AbrB family looped-hinge helix DNA binding protein
MQEPLARTIGAIRVGEKGQITVPAHYRKRHKLVEGSEMLLFQIGEALMVVPSDLPLQSLCQRIQEGLKGQGISVEQALKNLQGIRQRRFHRLYGKE